MPKRRPALLIAVIVMVATLPLTALASPPTTGLVVEGAAVPGGSIGDTRATIEASFGTASFCQSITAGDLASCTYNTPDGSVSVRYVGADGANAAASPTDLVHGFNFSGYPGWSTSTGISTSSTPDEVVAAYPDGVHTVGSFGFESVTVLERGFSWTKSVNPYFGTVRISISIFPPIDPDPDPDPDPEPTETVSIAELDLQLRRGAVTATVTVVDDEGDAVKGAQVSATWALPDGSTVTAEAATNRKGQAKLAVSGGPGTYTITIEDVAFDGHTFTGGEVTGSIQG